MTTCTAGGRTITGNIPQKYQTESKGDVWTRIVQTLCPSWPHILCVRASSSGLRSSPPLYSGDLLSCHGYTTGRHVQGFSSTLGFATRVCMTLRQKPSHGSIAVSGNSWAYSPTLSLIDYVNYYRVVLLDSDQYEIYTLSIALEVHWGK